MENRFQRQIKLKELGIEGQSRLQSSKVLIVGAGGLGCPALLYLAAAGIGRLGVIDFDRVELSNLHRQILFSVGDIGAFKAEKAAAHICHLYPGADCEAFSYELTNQNALELFSQFDIIIDGSDNFATRYLVNDACVLLGKPLIYGAVSRMEGQVAVFNLPTKKTPQPVNYRCLFPHPPQPGEAPNCEESGVLGVLPGIIGLMQANEAIKIIAGLEPVLANQLLSYHALTNRVYTIELTWIPEALQVAPMDEQAFRNMDYAWFCGKRSEKTVPAAALEDWLSERSWLVVDVRNAGEEPRLEASPYLQIPLPLLVEHLPMLEGYSQVLFFCQTGIRSAQAVDLLAQVAPHIAAFSLEGGILAWHKHLIS